MSFAAKLLNCSGKHESGRRRHSLCHVLGKAPNSFNISHCTYAFPSVIFFFFLTLGGACFLLKTVTRLSSWKNKYIRLLPSHLQVSYHQPRGSLDKPGGCLPLGVQVCPLEFNTWQSPRAKKGITYPLHIHFIYWFPSPGYLWHDWLLTGIM